MNVCNIDGIAPLLVSMKRDKKEVCLKSTIRISTKHTKRDQVKLKPKHLTQFSFDIIITPVERSKMSKLQNNSIVPYQFFWIIYYIIRTVLLKTVYISHINLHLLSEIRFINILYTIIYLFIYFQLLLIYLIIINLLKILTDFR